MLQHILFDNDGTLIDTEIVAVRVMLRHLEKYGVQITENEYCTRYPGMLGRDIVSAVSENYGIVFPDDFLEQVRQDHIDIFNTQVRSIPGMPGLFRKVKAPKSMVSNGSVRHVERSLRRMRLHKALDGHIFSAEQVERPKPFPDVYHLAVETVGADRERVLAIEDSPTGVQAAKEAGLRVVGFLGAGHIRRGHAESLLALGADYLAADARELARLLESFGVF